MGNFFSRLIERERDAPSNGWVSLKRQPDGSFLMCVPMPGDSKHGVAVPVTAQALRAFAKKCLAETDGL